MKPGQYNLVIYCGATVDRSSAAYTYKVGTTAVDLTGFTLRSDAQTDKGERVFHATTENGQIGLDPLTGTFWHNFTADETSAMWRRGLVPYSSDDDALFDAGQWNVEVVSADGRVVRLMHGRLLLSPEVPR
jgi:hypothetical protein